MKNSRGFTIIELLIVTAIFSIVLTGLTIALIQQQRQFKLTQEAIDLDQTARATLDYIATEIRNAVSRQGKTFSLTFANGGSGEDPPCSDNTGSAGSVDSPPDCLTIYTWDITRGQDNTAPNPLPSIPGSVSVVSQGPPLVLQLPPEWFPPFVPNPLIEAGDLLGFRSRINLCDPAGADCGANPALCTECATILRVTNINALNQAEINDTADVLEQNFQQDDFTDMTAFTTGFFIPSIASLASEMTIVQTRTFRIDTVNRELEMSQNGGNFQPIAGGADAPGIVDLQFVFNLQVADGSITKVGVPLDAANCRFPDFDELKDLTTDPSDPCFSREKDIRTVEIYLIVRSRIRPQLIRGQRIPVQTISQIGDVLQRNTDDDSLGGGFIYRVFSTTIYVRNVAREEFG